MYVCICMAVTERQISEAIANGHCTRKSLNSCLEAGTRCGKCNQEISQLLRRARVDSVSKVPKGFYADGLGMATPVPVAAAA